MKVIRNYIYNLGYQVLAIILPIITYPYISRILKPQGVGIYSYTYSIIQYFVLFAGLGISLYGNRQIAYVRGSSTKVSRTFVELIILQFISVLITYCIFLLFIVSYKKNTDYFFLQSFYIVAVLFDISWLFMGLEDFKKIVVRNILIKIGTVICIFIFVKNSSDVGIYIFIMSFGTLLGNITFWPYLKKIIVGIKLTQLHPFVHLVPSLMLFLPQITIQVYAQLNKTMLGAMRSEKDSGFYNYSDSIIKMSLTFITAVGTVMLPHIANEYAKGHKGKVSNLISKSFDYVSCLAFLLAAGLAGISLKFAPFFYGSAYKSVGIVMMIETLAIVPISWASVIGNQYLIPTNQMRSYTITVIIGAIINIILNVPFIMMLGLDGAMISTVISEWSVTLSQFFVVRKMLKLKYFLRNTLKYLIASFVTFTILFLSNSFLRMNLLTIIFQIFIGLITYIFSLYFLKANIIDELKSNIYRVMSKLNT